MSKTSPVDIVFSDLTYKYQELLNASQSPSDIRRLLGEFISTSLRMTAQMRRTNEKEEKFEAQFSGWNDISEVFKKLRNYDQHEWLIEIAVDEHYVFDVGGVDINAVCTREVDQLSTELSQDGIELYDADPTTGKITTIKAYKRKQLNQKYILSLREDSKNAKRVNVLISKAGENDLYYLLADYMETLTNFYNFYKESA